MTESTIQDAFAKWLTGSGIQFRRDRMDRATTGTIGWPDFTIIIGNRVLLIEMKTEKGAVSREQKELHERFKATGTTVHICRSADAAVELVTAWISMVPVKLEEPKEKLYKLGAMAWRKTDAGMMPVRPVRPGEVLLTP